MGSIPEQDPYEDPELRKALAGLPSVTAARTPHPGETCPCGRPAAVVFVTDDGHVVGFCRDLGGER